MQQQLEADMPADVRDIQQRMMSQTATPEEMQRYAEWAQSQVQRFMGTFNDKAYDRAQVEDALERHLRHEPQKVSRTRIKKLRGVSRPQYRLRVNDDVRVFYDVTEDTVEVLAIVPKSEANEWLERYGETDEESASDATQG